MKNKTIIWALMFLCLIGVVFGAATVRSPLTTSVNSGDAFINVSHGLVQGDTVVWCNLTLSSASNSNTTVYVHLKNDTAGTTEINLSTFDSTTLEDASDYALSGSCYNSTVEGTTNTSTITAVASVVVDNTVPVCSQSTLTSKTTIDAKAKTLTVTGTYSTAVTYTFMKNIYTMVEGSGFSDTFTHSMTGIPEGSGDLVVTCSDGRNTTAATTVTSLTLDTKSSAGKSTFFDNIGQGDDATSTSEKSAELTIPELKKTGMGAVAGAIVGTMIFPGLGTLGGAVIGGLIGVFF